MAQYQAVIFDWAGTLIDFGSRAPAMAFIETFAAAGVEPSVAEARAPMGAPKRDHIAAMCAMPRIADAWATTHGQPPGEADIDRLYADYIPRNIAAAAAHATLIPGVLGAIDTLRAAGMKIGTTTGYTREIMAAVLPRVAEQGFEPDLVICSDELVVGRPSPLGVYKSCVELGVYPAGATVKVDDTAPGIAEGTSAGAYTVGISASGNGVGLSAAELNALGDNERTARVGKAADALRLAGADTVIESVADLPAVLGL
ncbi:MAG: phosphonoacetaldehyde hydrolase [Pseudomonadota bacterium]